jgi:uncharacterized protein YndB with AHSA1/START domain
VGGERTAEGSLTVGYVQRAVSIVHVEIEIDAPPEVVFDTIMDPQRLGEWVTIHRSVKAPEGQKLRPGARMDQVLHMRGVSFTVHWELDSVNRPTEAKWIGRGPAMSKASIRYRLSGPPEGPTQFEYSNEFSTPGGALGAAASRVVVGHASEREAQHTLAKLKALLEAK